MPAPRSTFGKSLVNWLFPIYVAMIAAGFTVFINGWGTIVGNEPSTDRSLFHAVNAATMTGLPYQIGVREFNVIGRWTSLLLIAGGTLFSLVVGGLAMVRILRLPFSDRRIIVGSILLLLFLAGIGTAGGMATGRDWFESLFLGVSAFGNSGAVLDHPPELREPLTHLMLLPLGMLGGLGITVILELLRWARRRDPLTLHTRVVLGGLAITYLASFAVLLFLRWPAAGVLSPQWQQIISGQAKGSFFNDGAADWLISCSTLAINCRSLGMPISFDFVTSRPTQWALMIMMLIGAASAGTAGGLKVNTIAELYRGVRRVLSGQTGNRTFGIALIWCAIFFGMVVATQLMLVNAVGELSGDRVLFLTISALTNTGLSHEVISITGEGLFTLSAAMFAGRVVPLLILWWLADSTTDAEIAVG